mmetsp:Transcript_8371/g.33754  ORF Transcript_8371/g.33754 Transcript_8371/m.33754 type:complete len:314 (+) Transcript_8371:721-1662(+)
MPQAAQHPELAPEVVCRLRLVGIQPQTLHCDVGALVRRLENLSKRARADALAKPDRGDGNLVERTLCEVPEEPCHVGLDQRIVQRVNDRGVRGRLNGRSIRDGVVPLDPIAGWTVPLLQRGLGIRLRLLRRLHRNRPGRPRHRHRGLLHHMRRMLLLLLRRRRRRRLRLRRWGKLVHQGPGHPLRVHRHRGRGRRSRAVDPRGRDVGEYRRLPRIQLHLWALLRPGRGELESGEGCVDIQHLIAAVVPRVLLPRAPRWSLPANRHRRQRRSVRGRGGRVRHAAVSREQRRAGRRRREARRRWPLLDKVRSRRS